MKPQPADLIMVRAHDLLDDGIEAAQSWYDLRTGQPHGSDAAYTHVCVALDKGRIVEAIGRGVVISDASKYAGIADVWGMNLTIPQRERIMRKAKWMAANGYKYAYWDIAVLFLRLAFGLRVPWHERRAVICSVLAWDGYWATGIRIAPERNVWPSAIAQAGVLTYQGPFD